jgi:hypothetical protein
VREREAQVEMPMRLICLFFGSQLAAHFGSLQGRRPGILPLAARREGGHGRVSLETAQRACLSCSALVSSGDDLVTRGRR